MKVNSESTEKGKSKMLHSVKNSVDEKQTLPVSAIELTDDDLQDVQGACGGCGCGYGGWGGYGYGYGYPAFYGGGFGGFGFSRVGFVGFRRFGGFGGFRRFGRFGW